MAPQQDGFTDAYSRLNKAQRQAVDAIEGPVMVIAGPGTGKTQMLALRIANILRKTDTSPSSILALTFTESGVASMRARLSSLIGQEGYRVRVHTFHGFCNEVMRMYPDRFPDTIGRTPLIEIDAIGIVKEILETLRPPLLYPHGKPDFYVRDIIRKISATKREHLSPAQLSERITEERKRIEAMPDLYHAKGAHAGKMRGMYTTELRALEKADAFVEVYIAYERILKERGLYDFDDTIVTVIETLAKDHEFKLILQEEHQYILADEHQDANGSQNELLHLLSDFHDEPNLFIVGDEKQAIYRFQGASLDNFFGFTRQYLRATLITLEANYRSTQRILDAAHELIAPAKGSDVIARPRLLASAGHEDQALTVAVASDEDSEHSFIAERIATHISKGVPPSEIAVLVRRNADVAQIGAVLARKTIPYTAYGDDPLLTQPLVRGLIDVLRAIAEPGNDEVLYPALMVPYSNISTADIYRLTPSRVNRRKALIELLGDTQELAALDVHGVESCRVFGDMVTRAHKSMGSVALISCIESMLWKSGCLAYVMAQDNSVALLETVRAFFKYISSIIEAHPSYTLKDVLAAIDESNAYRIAIGVTPSHHAEAVAIMTVHRSKGMEFDHVIMPHVHDRMWGDRRMSDTLALPLFASSATRDVDDERRLMYVAMTRARKSLTLSYAEQSSEGAIQLCSRYIDAFANLCAHEHAGSQDVATFFATEASSQVPDGLSESERALLRARFVEQGLSVTALNNFLTSPWQYFFMNLLRVPQSRPPHLFYGSAVDAALKWYTDERALMRTPDTDALVERFTSALARQPLMKRDFDMYRERGIAALEGYLQSYSATWESRAESAVRIAVPFETGVPEVPLITLRGELDKVEFLSEDHVRVVDYKTGKPKTRGEIMGTTKNSNGNLKRQLTFYRLLIELDPTRAWQVDDALLDFVEPDTKGKYHREHFEVTTDDVEVLATTIKESVRAIATFAFWNDACDPQKWSDEGCALVTALRVRNY